MLTVAPVLLSSLRSPSLKSSCQSVLSILESLKFLKTSEKVYSSRIKERRVWEGVKHLGTSLGMLWEEELQRVKALGSIMEGLMRCKAEAEDLLVRLISDVIYLRTGGVTGNERRRIKKNEIRRGKAKRHMTRRKPSVAKRQCGRASSEVLSPTCPLS